VGLAAGPIKASAPSEVPYGPEQSWVMALSEANSKSWVASPLVVEDPNILTPKGITLSGNAGPYKRALGTYVINSGRQINGFPFFTMTVRWVNASMCDQTGRRISTMSTRAHRIC